MSGVLEKTKCYLVGSMENASGEQGIKWREDVTNKLLPLGITSFDPYKKPFIDDSLDEGQELIKQFRSKVINWQDDEVKVVSQRMKAIRSSDLNLVDRADFIIANINPRIASWGSAEEIFSGNIKKKPIFVAVQTGKRNVPLWLLGTLPHTYFYDSIDQIVEILTKINSGEIPIDSKRWRLLKPEYR